MTSNNASMTKSELEAALAEAQVKLAEANKPRKLSLKVGEKRGISCYGLNAKFPVTLYAQQWERLIEFVPQITAFIAANESKLSRRD